MIETRPTRPPEEHLCPNRNKAAVQWAIIPRRRRTRIVARFNAGSLPQPVLNIPLTHQVDGMIAVPCIAFPRLPKMLQRGIGYVLSRYHFRGPFRWIVPDIRLIL